MNKGYTFIDNNVIVEDEYGNKKVVEYSDNIEELLEQENLIEEINNWIFLSDKIMRYYEKNLKKEQIKQKLINLILDIAIVTCGSALLRIWCTDDIVKYTSELAALSFDTLLSFLPVSIGAFLTTYRVTFGDEFASKYNAEETELMFLKERLIIEKEKLNELELNKTKTNLPNEGETIKLSSAKLDRLYSLIRTYYDIGYNLKDYSKYYKNGNLVSKLEKKDYTEDEIMRVKDYFQDKSLIRTRK